MSPAMHRISVLLPAPFSPARATTSPARTVRSTPSRASAGQNGPGADTRAGRELRAAAARARHYDAEAGCTGLPEVG